MKGTYIRKLSVATAAALLLCLLPMPYGYYTLVRICSTIVFCVMAYQCYRREKETLTIIFCALAILFQPLMKIGLGRDMWTVVDVVVAIFLIVFWRKAKDV